MELLENIKSIITNNTCIVGMGNYLRNDDAAGLVIVDELLKKIEPEEFNVYNVEDIIEGYVFKISDLDCKDVIVIDAVYTPAMDLQPGSIVFGKLEEFDELINDLSTHKLSLQLSGKILKENGKNVYLLGIIAEDIDYGMNLSDSVKESTELISNTLMESLTCNKKEYSYEQ